MKRKNSSDAATKTSELPLEDQKNIILSIFNDFAGDPDKLFKYFNHVGFDLNAVSDIRDLPAAWLGYYRIKAGSYDVDQACMHLATWPPIAARIIERLTEKNKPLAK